MVTESGVAVGIALAILATTAVVLAALGIGAIRRWRGGQLGRAYGRILAFLAGVMFGTMFLLDAGAESRVILAVFVVGYAVLSWRRGRWTDAGLIVAGAALPWTALWALYAWAMVTGRNDSDPPSVCNGLAVGAVPLAIGLGIAALADRQPPTPRQDSSRWQPGARTIGTIATAIRGSTASFGSQEIAAIIAIVVVQIIGGLLAFGLGIDPVYFWIVPAVVASIAATEAYVRVIPAFNRKAFEAFSWLGEEELRRLKAQSGEGPPLNERAADRWLERHGRDPDLAWALPEILLVAGRNKEAQRAAEAMPDDTPYERVERASVLDFVAWMDRRETGLDDLAAAVEAVPDGTDDRLRAEVILATATTRRRMSDGRTEPGDAARPLVEVRERLGSRADGQIGRALRRRILPIFLAVSLGLGLLQPILAAVGLGGS